MFQNTTEMQRDVPSPVRDLRFARGHHLMATISQIQFAAASENSWKSQFLLYVTPL